MHVSRFQHRKRHWHWTYDYVKKQTVKKKKTTTTTTKTKPETTSLRVNRATHAHPKITLTRKNAGDGNGLSRAHERAFPENQWDGVSEDGSKKEKKLVGSL